MTVCGCPEPGKYLCDCQRCCNCGSYEEGRHNPGCSTFREDYEPYTSWRGIGFDVDEWEWGVNAAADRADRNGIVPRILIVWELVKPEYLPWWMPITVPVVRWLWAHGLYGRSIKHPAPPLILTIGQYGLNKDENEEIPF